MYEISMLESQGVKCYLGIETNALMSIRDYLFLSTSQQKLFRPIYSYGELYGSEKSRLNNFDVKPY